MILLRCPKFLRCLTADAGNFDRSHSLTSHPLPLAALSSLPTSARRPRTPYKNPCHCEGAPRPWQSASPVPRPPCKNPCHCEPVIDSLLWQSASPVLNGPLPKGGRHSKAVTGGYISVPHSLCPKMPPAAPFLSPAKEREKRTPPKPMVLDSLRGHGTGNIGAPQPRE